MSSNKNNKNNNNKNNNNKNNKNNNNKGSNNKPSNNKDSDKSSSDNSSMTMSFSSKDTNSMAMVGLVAIIFLALGAYFYMYKSNRNIDAFTQSSEPNLTVTPNECIVALFYADWCPHCVKFKPSFKEAKSSMDGKMYKGKKMRFEMVDCDAFKHLSKKYDVNGYPTVKILNTDGSSTDYDGERSLKGLQTYLTTNN